MAQWQTTRFLLDLTKPLVMGIVNVTPDSFADGGQHSTTSSALAHCERLLREGADILDLGGESSRPGAPPLPLDVELSRVLPVLRSAVHLGVPVSVDTYKPQVMQAALDAGADIINDIWALRQAAFGLSALDVVAGHPSCGVCLMHMHGEPATMQLLPMAADADAMSNVLTFLEQRTDILLAAGLESNRVVWDAGIGFGKTVQHNLALLAQQVKLTRAGYAVLAGWSRKSTLGAVTGLPLDKRMMPSVVAAVMAVERGAKIVRVHDVQDTVNALKLWTAVGEQQ